MYKSYVRKNPIKEILKSFYRNFILKSDSYPVLVASIGRAGSTMLFNYLAKASAQHVGVDNLYAQKSMKCQAWNLQKDQKFINGCIYKTHDLPSDLIKFKKIKIIYLHDMPSNIISSILNITKKEGKGWLEDHLKHLGCDSKDSSYFLEKEIFNIENHLRSWNEYDGKNIIFVDYNDIWKDREKIEKFVGFKIELPAKRQRESASEVPEQIRIDIAKMYNSLDKLYERLYLKKFS